MLRPHRSNRRSLRLEALEARQLMAANVVATALEAVIPEELERSLTPQECLASYVQWGTWERGPLGPSTLGPSTLGPSTLETFATQAALNERLAGMVNSYWAGVLDKPIDQIELKGNGTWFWPILSPDGTIITLEHASVPVSMAATGITNVQLAEIDEADRVELTNDGYLYVLSPDGLSRGGLNVVDLRDPSKMQALPVLSDQSDMFSHNLGLMVVGDRLVKLSHFNDAESIYGTNIQRHMSKTRIQIFDITQRIQPKLVSSLVVEGHNLATRTHAGQLTLVQHNGHTLILPQPQVVQASDGQARYESASSYLERNEDELIKSILPNYSQGDPTAAQDIGTWDDISIAASSLRMSTSIVRIDLTADNPALVDSEVIMGLNAPRVFMTANNIYLYQPHGTSTHIYRIDAQSPSLLKAVEKVIVPGQVLDSRWMSEEKGVLRVATRGGTNPEIEPLIWRSIPLGTGPDETPMPTSVTPVGGANIYTIADTGNRWEIVGKLEDLAAGQLLLGAYYDGDQALVTTGDISEGAWFFDPLHGIDLTDPMQPRELSELVIPGFTTYLHRVDQTHWLGLGWDQGNNNDDPMAANLKVSLYEASDLANPRVIDTWISDQIRVWPGMGLNALGIHFDAASGLLALGGISVNLQPNAQRRVSPPVLKVDVHANKPLMQVEMLDYPEAPQQVFVHNGHLFAVSANAVHASPIDQLTSQHHFVFLPNTRTDAAYNFAELKSGETITIPVIAGWGSELYTIISVANAFQVRVRVTDGSQLEITAPQLEYTAYENLQVKVRYFDGQEATVHLSLNLVGPNDSLAGLTSPHFSDAHAKILTRFENDQGQVITELSMSDEVWVVISAQDARELGSGVFSAYFEVNFNSANIAVIGDVEHLGEFVNGRRAQRTLHGFSLLGGFGDAQQDSTEPQDIVRFRLRVNDSMPVTLTVSPSSDFIGELLLYGENRRLKPENIETSVLTAGGSLQTAGEATPHDVNGDGNVTGLDVLWIINFINAQYDMDSRGATGISSLDSMAAYDLNQDGAVTGADVLQVINTINRRLDEAAEGESSLPARELAWVTDLAFEQLLEVDRDGVKRKSRRA